MDTVKELPKLKKLRHEMKKVLKESRYEHTLSVAYTAANLASIYKVDVPKALVAGMLHDCAKCLTDEERLHICYEADIPVTPLEKKQPFLLHAKVGAYLAKTKYDIEDRDILQSIASHTTGRPEMSNLEKIIFIADYMEPGRDHAPNLDTIRKEAFTNLDQALLHILTDTLAYLNSTDGEIDPQTELTWKYYDKLAIKQQF
ncbi:MAG: bis(5'-nucleosyl)-tetraphosphatase (symmetrical) YqeK [Lachnospiraceae bacterium]|nr:bis(5'-nucleosyl)-tetraphosphatase (symmetrical) YqeK [Lachnospiraceae bacterium]